MKTTTIKNVSILDIPKIIDSQRRGNLCVIENKVLPYKVERVYYLFDVPSDASRGGHSHIACHEFLVAISGSFDVIVKDGKNTKTVTLNKPDKGLLIVDGIWRELDNFSSGAVCLVLASEKYNEEDYIREYASFLESK
ncbi:FdtA/QdtA family cupin domain-containing protein [Lacinutrix sp.]|uniref:sugar 3,4-ketoisomerase n=1 Tax=Lacinutrix sp. TaxID=1937692 RepID=UPI00261D33BC|nr:FdtA/QdtA family cupin domain-containing protein [Lacinutrix sp.]MDG1714110.1 FdtA/QdtA family cupin domain-containing protein [Lacinutrix sp.]